MISVLHSRPSTSKLVERVLVCAVVLVSFAVVNGAGTASAEDNCLSTVVIGAAGTDQGPQHIPPALDSNDRVAQFGAEVATAITAFTDTLGGPALLAPINYPATGVKWGSAVVAKVAYDASAYKLSKDTGYSRAYDELKKRAAACSSAKFTLVGYSQGAHIMGDLAQSVFHGNGPVDRTRIGAVILIADPAYNGSSPRTTEAIFDKDKLTQDQDHWKIGGSLGQRAAFAKTDPVVSICVYGDPVCDGQDLSGQDGKFKPATNQWMHALYRNHVFESKKDIATWVGVQGAQVIRPAARVDPGPAPAELPGNPSLPSAPTAPAPSTHEPVTIAQSGAKTVTVTVVDAAGAGARAIRCWNSTDATHSWKTNYLGEVQADIPRNGTFTVTCPTAPKAGTFSLEFLNWRWSPAIQWR
ncbi:cutinase family protein [Nocardia sp. NPDC127606]|uniref:cutinase family protein n=1 Tax=Nocardia sp. NPDC127606 TaxID=3345406 RepID=UPI00362D6BFD